MRHLTQDTVAFLIRIAINCDGNVVYTIIWFADACIRSDAYFWSFIDMAARYQKTLSDLFPEVAKEWHPTRNGAIRPDSISPFSKKKVWWQCAEHPQHVWDAVIGNRTGRKSRCPFCAGRRADRTNSLAALRPDL